MTRLACPFDSATLLDELLRESHSEGTGPGDGVDETPDFLRFPRLHDRVEASRACPGSAPYGLWSGNPWGDDAA